MAHPIEILPITNKFRIDVSSTVFSTTDEVANKTAEIWNFAVNKPNTNLFDGPILCATTVNETACVCKVVPYRFFYAQRQAKEIRDALQLKALAVSGITMRDHLIYFGRRSRAVTQYPSLIELVPSGSLNIDCVKDGLADYHLQLTEELVEELGFGEFAVKSIEPLFLTFDLPELTYDVYCKIILKSNPIRHSSSTSFPEYEQIWTVASSEIVRLISTESDQLVPTTLAVLKRLLPYLPTDSPSAS